MKRHLGIVALAGLLFGIAIYMVVTTGTGELGVPLFVAHLVVMVSIGILLFSVVFPLVIFRVPEAQLAATVRRIRALGQPIASVRAGGLVGWLELRGPLMRVTLYPVGIVVEPLLLTTFGVMVTDFVDLGFSSGVRTLGQSRLIITHRSSQVASSIRLWCAEDHPFAVELLSLAGKQTPVRLASTG